LPEAVAPAGVSSVTVGGALREAALRLAAAGADTPRLDAEVLLAFVLGVGRERLVLDASRSVDDAALERFNGLIARRAAREPVAYITGVREFRRISLHVDRRVLVPRPETELLVEVGLGLRAGARVADVGTGSGAVALALKDERPDLSVVGVDVDGGALAVARGNARRAGLDVTFVQADLLGEGEVLRGAEAVLANLPYVASRSSLPPEIALYEPAGALFGGADGLDVIRRLVPMASEVALLALEIGFDQAPAVSELLTDAGFGSVERLRDLAGHERVIVGRR
jgi:release factor glutamine methyltransferase